MGDNTRKLISKMDIYIPFTDKESISTGWSTYTCKINNHKTAQVLIDLKFKNKAPLKELPLLLWIGVYCQMPSGRGFHNPNENSKLDEIEDNLINLCGLYGNGWAVYTHRIGTTGIREYYFYHGEQAELYKAVESLLSLYPSYKIEVETFQDKGWNEYKKYLI